MDYYEGKLNHLWVDLFILDKLPEGKLASEMTRFIHKAIYVLAMGHRHDLDYSRYSLLHKIFVGGLATAGKLIPLKWIISMQKWAALKDRKSKGSRWYYSNYQPDYLYVTLLAGMGWNPLVLRRQLHIVAVNLCKYLMIPLGDHQLRIFKRRILRLGAPVILQRTSGFQPIPASRSGYLTEYDKGEPSFE